MKIKCVPEDFRVEELSEFRPTGGPYALYRLTKRSIGTPEALDLILRAWNVHRRRASYGGLKDRHALTRQFLTIHQGPRRPFRESGVELEFLGYADRAFGPHDIAGNRFEIVLRDMAAAEVALAVDSLAAVSRDGLPNYFDDQRFGSVGLSRDFIARVWCLGDFERALWLALADPTEDDRAAERKEKQLLQENWGRWAECKTALSRSNRRSLVSYLVDHPQDFRGAFARLKVDLRGLYLAAFQSHLWNLMLAEVLRHSCAGLADVALKLGAFPFTTLSTPRLPDEVTKSVLPLPSARIRHEVGPHANLMSEVVSRFGLELRQLRVKYPRDSFFAKGSRAAFVSVDRVVHEASEDELYPHRQKLRLEFTLPRGSYATMLIKRITEASREQ